MILNQANLQLLTTGFKASFREGLGMVTPMWDKVATMVPSSTAAEHYAWLGQFPRLREWIGDRVVKSITNHDYTIRNKDFEVTVGVPRNAIEDDQFGVYSPMMTEMGSAATTHPDEIIFAALKNGFSSPCYDGQNFFDTDHPIGLPGAQTTVSNMQPGPGPAWFLLDTKRSLKPLIYQRRKPYDFVAKFDPRLSDHVFFNKEFVYGVDGRLNAGFGFWQLAAGSMAALTPANFQDLYTGMTLLKSDEGRPLGIKPNVIVHGNGLQWQVKALIDTQFVAAPGGGDPVSNIFYKIVDTLQVPWLD